MSSRTRIELTYEQACRFWAALDHLMPCDNACATFIGEGTADMMADDEQEGGAIRQPMLDREGHELAGVPREERLRAREKERFRRFVSRRAGEVKDLYDLLMQTILQA